MEVEEVEESESEAGRRVRRYVHRFGQDLLAIAVTCKRSCACSKRLKYSHVT